ncbi:MAG: hypothetical protein SNF68_06615 [Rikenellaceae bacterium]
MERRVKFNTTTKFEIAEEELKYLYTLMALIQYPYDCDPKYRDHNLIRRLHNDFNRFNQEMAKACESDPNNLVLSQVRNFVQRHYGYLRRVNKNQE